MSYARFGATSDVYVYAHVGGFVECCGCKLGDNWEHHSAAEIVDHLREHVAAGHLVAERLLDPAVYPSEDFVPMCDFFMCRELQGHSGGHTPLADELYQLIRAQQAGVRGWFC